MTLAKCGLVAILAPYIVNAVLYPTSIREMTTPTLWTPPGGDEIYKTAGGPAVGPDYQMLSTTTSFEAVTAESNRETYKKKTRTSHPVPSLPNPTDTTVTPTATSSFSVLSSSEELKHTHYESHQAIGSSEKTTEPAVTKTEGTKTVTVTLRVMGAPTTYTVTFGG